MSFGAASGPPASTKQVRELLELLTAAGHTDFRDARGPMGFTQRQAAGKFTRAEADAYIAQLQDSAQDVPGVGGPRVHVPPRTSAAEQALRRVPTDQLAAELQRRGWIVVEP